MADRPGALAHLDMRLVTTLGVDPAFWAGRRVLLTGHTGFKGAWAALWLAQMGAEVTGLALESPSGPGLFALAHVERDIVSRTVDVRDPAATARAVVEARPEIVLHLAAQSLVRRARAEPVETFATNLGGTVHLLNALRACPNLSCVLIVTTDKVYENDGGSRAFLESDRLGGAEPYAASKAAAELATAAMARCYFPDVPVATARGGNVIGGGDFAEDRLVPDLVRAIRAGATLRLRNPGATRPWQHVLDCLAGYLVFAQALVRGTTSCRALNFGPPPGDPTTVGTLVASMSAILGATPELEADPAAAEMEAMTLAIDSSLARSELGWGDRLSGRAGLEMTAAWYRAWSAGEDMRIVSLGQISRFAELARAAV